MVQEMFKHSKLKETSSDNKLFQGTPTSLLRYLKHYLN